MTPTPTPERKCCLLSGVCLFCQKTYSIPYTGDIDKIKKEAEKKLREAIKNCPCYTPESRLREFEEMYERIKPLVGRMRAKYPEEQNIEGFEPALTSDIAEIVLDVLSQERERARGKLGKSCTPS